MPLDRVRNPSECRFLVVDDEKSLCDLLVEALKEQYFVEACYTAGEAFGCLEKADYDVVIADLKLPDGSGIDILRAAKEKDRHTEVIIITGYASLETASEAIGLGVSSYISKPLVIKDLQVQIDKAVASRIFHLKSLLLMAQADSYGESPEVRNHILDITALYYFASKLSYSLELHEIIRIILNEAIDRFGALRCVIGARYLDFKEIFVMPRSGELKPDRIVESLVRHWAPGFDVFSREEVESGDVPVRLYSGERNGSDPVGEQGMTCRTLPVAVLGETVGFIGLFLDVQEPFGQRKQQFFHVFSSLVSSAVQHAYHDLQAKLQAKTDSLTGVANHRMFHETLNREMSRADRSNRFFSLALLDIDDFKKVNDMHGHQVGDAVLIHLTRQLSGMIRLGDVLARYGGEEFALILHDTAPEDAEVLAGRICGAVARASYVDSGLDVPYTVSIGLAGYDPGTRVKKDVLIGRADESLYKAKRAGKNRVVVNSK